MSIHPPIRRTRFAALASAAIVGVALTIVGAGPAGAQPTPTIRNADAKNAIAGRYIVVFKDGSVPKQDVRVVTDRLASKHRAAVGLVYSHALRGFSAKMTSAEARRLSIDPAVAFVEQDRQVTINATQSAPPSWGLDRISQRNLPLNNAYGYVATGAGVTAYVIDTGIRLTHDDFGGRATWGTNTTGDGNNSDCSGHGTHVAGTIGGAAYGVAKAVKLVAVKVLDCAGSGAYSAVTAGVDWVTANHTGGPAVANMSLGSSGSDPALESAIRSSISDGVVYGIASGNDDADACNYSPARVSEAITVNATNGTDARAMFSNYGTCTDIFAPGQDITSDWNTSNTATNSISGTSMATPHVVGAAALILSATPTATPAQVASKMIANSTPSKVTDAWTGSPNRLLYAGGATAPLALPSGCKPATNGTDLAIPDLGTATSKITISGCSGNALTTSTIDVHIVHTYPGDLVVDLVTPNGTTINLLNRAGYGTDNVDKTFTRDLSAYAVNSSWSLRVRDSASGDTGYLNSWTLGL